MPRARLTPAQLQRQQAQMVNVAKVQAESSIKTVQANVDAIDLTTVNAALLELDSRVDALETP